MGYLYLVSGLLLVGAVVWHWERRLRRNLTAEDKKTLEEVGRSVQKNLPSPVLPLLIIFLLLGLLSLIPNEWVYRFAIPVVMAGAFWALQELRWRRLRAKGERWIPYIGSERRQTAFVVIALLLLIAFLGW